MRELELLDAKRSLVVVIDLQGKLVDMVFRPSLVIDATRRLLQIAGLFEVPVLLTEQYPQGIGPTIPEIRSAFDALTTPKRAITKVAFGCCGEPSFLAAIDELLPGCEPGARQLILAGIEAHVCVHQTALGLLARGERVQLCWECVSGRGEEYRRHALARLERLGVEITNHETVAFEWARSNEHPVFKRLNRILREGQIAG